MNTLRLYVAPDAEFYLPRRGGGTTARAAVRSTTAHASGTTGSFTVTRPAGVVAGDVLIAVHVTDVGTGSAMGTPTGGTTWTLIGQAGRRKVWRKTAGGSEPSSYGFTQSSTADGVVIIVAVRDADTSQPPVAVLQTTGGSGTVVPTPSGAPDGERDLELRFAAGQPSGPSVSFTGPPGAGLTELADLHSGGFIGAAAYGRQLSGGGATGVHDVTGSASMNQRLGITVTVASVPPGVTADDPDSWPWVEVPHLRRGEAGVTVVQGARESARHVDTAVLTGRLSNHDGQITALALPKNSPVRVTVEPVGHPETVLFQGIVPRWPTRWNPAGARDSFVPLQAYGILGHINAAEETLESALVRSAAATSTVVAYWPMEDGSTAAEFTSPVDGVPAGSFSGDAALGSVTGPGGSLQLPGFRPGSSFTLPVPVMPAGVWRVDWVFRCDEPTSTLRTALRVHTTSGNAARWRVRFSSSTLRVEIAASGSDEFAVVHTNDTSIHPDFAGRWVRMTLRVRQQGSAIVYDLTVSEVGRTRRILNTLSSTVTSRQAGRPTRAGIELMSATPPSRTVGHVTVSSDLDVDPFGDNAESGHDGELATVRFSRLCGEEGIPHRIVGDVNQSAPMGPQRPGGFLALLRECETADGGVLFEAGHGIQLGLRTRLGHASQTPVLHIAPGQLWQPPEPDDDPVTANDVTVSRPGGGSARAAVRDEVIRRHGRHAGGGPVNVVDDSWLQDIAEWLLGHGTWPGWRWPSLSVNTAREGSAALLGPLLALVPGDRATGELVTPQLTIGFDVLLRGWSLSATREQLAWGLFSSPAGPWRVAILDDPEFGRMDTDASELAAPAGPGDVTLSVRVLAGPPWIDSVSHPGLFPFGLRLGDDEVVEVTAVDPIDGDMHTVTVVRGPDATAHPAGTPVGLPEPNRLA